MARGNERRNEIKGRNVLKVNMRSGLENSERREREAEKSRRGEEIIRIGMIELPLQHASARHRKKVQRRRSSMFVTAGIACGRPMAKKNSRAADDDDDGDVFLFSQRRKCLERSEADALHFAGISRESGLVSRTSRTAVHDDDDDVRHTSTLSNDASLSLSLLILFL